MTLIMTPTPEDDQVLTMIKMKKMEKK